MHDTIINTNCNITQYMANLMAVLLPRVTLVIGYVTACIQSCVHIRETPWALKPRQEKTVCQLRICQRIPLRVRASLCGVLLHVLLHCAVVRECGVFAGHEAPSDAMNNIIVPLYHMRCHLAEVRIVHEGQFVSRIF